MLWSHRCVHLLVIAAASLAAAPTRPVDNLPRGSPGLPVLSDGQLESPPHPSGASGAPWAPGLRSGKLATDREEGR